MSADLPYMNLFRFRTPDGLVYVVQFAPRSIAFTMDPLVAQKSASLEVWESVPIQDEFPADAMKDDDEADSQDARQPPQAGVAGNRHPPVPPEPSG